MHKKRYIADVDRFMRKFTDVHIKYMVEGGIELEVIVFGLIGNYFLWRNDFIGP